MNYNCIGRTGVKVSPLGLGTMTFGKETSESEAAKIFRACRTRGLNLLDTANVYCDGRTEQIVGRLLADCREEWVICSKFQGRMGTGPNDRGASRRHILQAVEGSLSRLKTDRIDFYFLHNIDSETPLDETIRALDDLVRQGKILYPAISNAAAWQVMKGLGISDCNGFSRFACIQPMYNLVKRQAEVELLPMAQAEGLGVLIYSPVAAGLLTGKYKKLDDPISGRLAENKFYQARYNRADYHKTAENFVQFCREMGWQSSTVAISWAASHPAVTAPIVGARNLAQMESSLAALDFKLEPHLRDEISALSDTPPLATDRLDEQLGLFIH